MLRACVPGQPGHNASVNGAASAYAFSSPRRPSARSSPGCIFMSWNSLGCLRADHAVKRIGREERPGRLSGH